MNPTNTISGNYGQQSSKVSSLYSNPNHSSFVDGRGRTYTNLTENPPSLPLNQSLLQGFIPYGYPSHPSYMAPNTFNVSFGLSAPYSEELATQILGFQAEVNDQRAFTSQICTRDASKIPENEGEKSKTQVFMVPSYIYQDQFSYSQPFSSPFQGEYSPLPSIQALWPGESTGQPISDYAQPIICLVCGITDSPSWTQKRPGILFCKDCSDYSRQAEENVKKYLNFNGPSIGLLPSDSAEYGSQNLRLSAELNGQPSFTAQKITGGTHVVGETITEGQSEKRKLADFYPSSITNFDNLRSCFYCKKTETPEWREGLNQNWVCNACGLQVFKHLKSYNVDSLAAFEKLPKDKKISIAEEVNSKVLNRKTRKRQSKKRKKT